VSPPTLILDVRKPDSGPKSETGEAYAAALTIRVATLIPRRIARVAGMRLATRFRAEHVPYHAEHVTLGTASPPVLCPHETGDDQR
jgi:hypothetical protein